MNLDRVIVLICSEEIGTEGEATHQRPHVKAGADLA